MKTPPLPSIMKRKLTMHMETTGAIKLAKVVTLMARAISPESRSIAIPRGTTGWYLPIIEATLAATPVAKAAVLKTARIMRVERGHGLKPKVQYIFPWTVANTLITPPTISTKVSMEATKVRMPAP